MNRMWAVSWSFEDREEGAEKFKIKEDATKKFEKQSEVFFKKKLKGSVLLLEKDYADGSISILRECL